MASDPLEGLLSILEDHRIMKFSEDLVNQKLKLPYTAEMICSAYLPGISEEERKNRMTLNIREFELLYRENKHDIPDLAHAPIEDAITCALSHVPHGAYGDSISDVHIWESSFFMQKYAPNLPNIMRETYALPLLAGRMVSKMGGLFFVSSAEPEEPEDHADDWKKRN